MTDTSREALIRELRCVHAVQSDEGPSTFSEAADMLEADLSAVRQIADVGMRHGLTLVKTAAGYEFVSLGKVQAHAMLEAGKRKPLSDEQIYKVAKRITEEEAAPFDEVSARPGWSGFVEIVRNVERAHGIGAKP